ncbi:MAG: hypothetical protein PF505_11610 [Vallitaleaceae bacterium]|jgi:large-conductance mechanosensitive channel|nr:hypothetical protein [Vallitaleaceae bacterium]
MSKKRKLSIIALVVLGGLYLVSIIVGFLGYGAITLTIIAFNSVLSIIIFFVLKNIERNTKETEMLLKRQDVELTDKTDSNPQ